MVEGREEKEVMRKAMDQQGGSNCLNERCLDPEAPVNPGAPGENGTHYCIRDAMTLATAITWSIFRTALVLSRGSTCVATAT